MSQIVVVNGVRYRKEDADRMVQAELAAVVTERVSSKAEKVAAFLEKATEADLDQVVAFEENREEFAAWQAEKAERAAEVERERAEADAAAAKEKADADAKADAAAKKAAEKAPAAKKPSAAPSAPAGE